MTLSQMTRKVVAVVVKTCRLPLALQSVRGDPLLELLLRDGAGPRQRHLGEVSSMSCMTATRPRLDHVAVKVLRAVQSNTDVPESSGAACCTSSDSTWVELASDVVYRTFDRV